MADADGALSLVFAYLDGTSTDDQTEELLRRLPMEPELARHLAAQCMVTSILETMGRQHLEETSLRRAISASRRRPTVPMWQKVAAAAAIVLTAVGLYYWIGPGTARPQPADRPGVTPSETDVAAPEEAPAETTSSAMLAEGPVLFEENFETGLQNWKISKASIPFVKVEKIERDGTMSECVVLDTYGRKGKQAAIVLKKALRAKALAIEYDYRISEPGGDLCPFFGFVVAKPAAVKGIRTYPSRTRVGTGEKRRRWVHARFELLAMTCPKAGPFVWVKKFENRKPVCAYYVPCGMKDLRIGTFWTVNARVAVDNVVIRGLDPAKKGSMK